MRLSHWLQDEIKITPEYDRDITGITSDSRRVELGNAFIAISGKTQDGREYNMNAVTHGASVILLESDGENVISQQDGIIYISIKNLHEKLGELAARFYDYPAKKLRMIGVTGTNGKTSCSQFIAQLLEAHDVRCAVVGTLGSGFLGALVETGFTTPDAITLQALLQQFVLQGAQAVAMEVSSHSIDQGRINGIEFELGLFTNLTQDHLDYHGDMETYANVKYSYLASAATQRVIINADDAYGLQWIEQLKKKKPVYAYTLDESIVPPKVATGYVSQLKLSLKGIQAMVHTPWGEGLVEVPLIGKFNVSNMLLALMAACAYGVLFQEVVLALKNIASVPGRMQAVSESDQPLCVVDYAHTPDALDKVLSSLRGHTTGQLICVFGCGGDRDQAKRPLMAKIVEQWADKIIVTSDNPRHEKPEEIAAAIMAGFSHPERVHVELDRSKAIEKSIQWATKDDCVLIAGKGAEQYQQIGALKIPFDDVKKVTEIFHAALVK